MIQIQEILHLLIKILLIQVPILVAVAYFTHAERKILGAIQRRRGPNVVGVYGLLQPLSDGFKLFVKEPVAPSSSNSILFNISPLLTFIISLIGWSLVPYSDHSLLADCHVGFLILFAVSAVGVYGIVMAGWASNSKYAFLGSLRSTSQMVSYELSISFIVITICICNGSFNINDIVQAQQEGWFVITYFPLFIIFFICGLAETNRHPFDLPEAEAELVSGYNVEYSGMAFALFSLGEYANILMMSTLIIILFWGGGGSSYTSFQNTIYYINENAIEIIQNDELNKHVSLPIYTKLMSYGSFGLKICLFVALFVIMRAALPRYRYDQLMTIGWKIILPITLIYCLFTIGLYLGAEGLPH